jgi:hypothetical protein
LHQYIEGRGQKLQKEGIAMKLRTEKGKWIVSDRGREIEFEDVIHAVYYCFLMKDFEKQIAPPHCVYPVRSLVPHPKKRRVTKKWREKINRIKRNFELGVHGE